MHPATQRSQPARPAWLAALAAALLISLPATRAAGADLPEPATVFYGQVWATGSGEPYLAADGQLAWTLRRSDGSALTVHARLRPLLGGVYSYRLDVPHSALAFGVAAAPASVGLGTAPETVQHFRITVDGQPARILGPNGSSFDASQARRAATYRCDLAVGLEATDADGNGLPDWWETRYRLNDASGDTDGDGWNNLAEFRSRSDPRLDNRRPSLASREVRVHAHGFTLVSLRSVDSDSAPEQLVYTLTQAPESGHLVLRNAWPVVSAPDAPLGPGSTFTQADLQRGRVVYAHADSEAPAEDARFEVQLRDEDPTHPPVSGTVALSFFRPRVGLPLATLAAAATRWPALPGVPADDQPLLLGSWLGSAHGYIVADGWSDGAPLQISAPSAGLTAAAYAAGYMTAYGPERSHVLLGGLAADRLTGGMADDVIVGHRGDDTLRGGGGSDVFVLTGPNDGSDRIEDFSVTDGDTIDLSRALAGESIWATNYVQMVPAGADTVLLVDPSGVNPAAGASRITLAGVQATDLREWVESGRIITGDKEFASRLTLVVKQGQASENGPSAAVIALTRRGLASGALTVPLQITGSAANGVDYAHVSPAATFLPGERSLNIEILPYVDALTELTEVVQVSVLPGSGYELGVGTTVQVSIEDLAPQISIEALEPVAVKSDLYPGLFVITRSGVIDRSVLVRLSVSGSASRTDYESIPSYVNLLPWQTTALVAITPKAGAVLSDGVEYVQIGVRADAAYKLGGTTEARVYLVEEQLTFDLWRERHFTGVPGDLAAFARADAGQTGIGHLQRYAFGLDPLSPQGSAGRPFYAVKDGHLTVTYRRPMAVTDVRYVVEVSEDMVVWHAGDNYVEPVSGWEVAAMPEAASFRVRRPINADRTMFMRVRLVYAP